jgi:hypothetical protein
VKIKNRMIKKIKENKKQLVPTEKHKLLLALAYS